MNRSTIFVIITKTNKICPPFSPCCSWKLTYPRDASIFMCMHQRKVRQGWLPFWITSIMPINEYIKIVIANINSQIIISLQLRVNILNKGPNDRATLTVSDIWIHITHIKIANNTENSVPDTDCLKFYILCITESKSDYGFIV